MIPSSPSVRRDPLSLANIALRGWQLLILAACGWVLLLILDATRSVVVPVAAGALIAALLAPLASLLRAKLPAYAAASVAMVSFLGVIVLASWLSGQQLVSGVTDLVESFPDMLNRLEKQWANLGLGLGGDQVQSAIDSAEEWLRRNGNDVARHAVSAGSSAVNMIVATALALVAAFFFLADGRGMWTYVLGMLPSRHRASTDRAFDAGWLSVQRYIRAQLIVAAADAIGIGIGAWILGVPFALPIAVIVFLTAFVPVVGAFASGALATIIAFAAVGPTTALIMLGIVVAIQQLESNVLQPVVMGRAVSLHPFAVIVSVSLGAYLAGIVGAVFAVPLLALAKSTLTELLRNHDEHDREGQQPGSHDDEGQPPGQPSDDQGGRQHRP